MQMLEPTESRRTLAIEALKSVLTHVSGVKLKNIDVDTKQQLESVIDIIAQIEVYGHAHTLACMLVSSDEPQPARESILDFCERTLKGAAGATPVLIAPRLSTDLQRLARGTNAGVLDLAGNARIELGETFIACQHVSRPVITVQRKAPRVQAAKRSTHATV